jgi:hypothetical protein
MKIGTTNVPTTSDKIVNEVFTITERTVFTLNASSRQSNIGGNSIIDR